jgi:hypothetical protein
MMASSGDVRTGVLGVQLLVLGVEDDHEHAGEYGDDADGRGEEVVEVVQDDDHIESNNMSNLIINIAVMILDVNSENIQMCFPNYLFIVNIIGSAY